MRNLATAAKRTNMSTSLTIDGIAKHLEHLLGRGEVVNSRAVQLHGHPGRMPMQDGLLRLHTAMELAVVRTTELLVLIIATDSLDIFLPHDIQEHRLLDTVFSTPIVLEEDPLVVFVRGLDGPARGPTSANREREYGTQAFDYFVLLRYRSFLLRRDCDPALAFPAVGQDSPMNTGIKPSQAFVLGSYTEDKPNEEFLFFMYVESRGVDNAAAVKVEEAESGFRANEAANKAPIWLLKKDLSVGTIS